MYVIAKRMANRSIVKLQQTLDMSVPYVIINETSPVFNVPSSSDSPTAQKIMSHGGRESPVVHNSSKDYSDLYVQDLIAVNTVLCILSQIYCTVLLCPSIVVFIT